MKRKQYGLANTYILKFNKKNSEHSFYFAEECVSDAIYSRKFWIFKLFYLLFFTAYPRFIPPSKWDLSNTITSRQVSIEFLATWCLWKVTIKRNRIQTLEHVAVHEQYIYSAPGAWTVHEQYMYSDPGALAAQGPNVT